MFHGVAVDDSMEFFIGTSTPHGKLGFIENYGVNN